MKVTHRKVRIDTAGGPSNLRYLHPAEGEKSIVPVPGEGEVTIKVLASTCTYTDLLVIQGNYRPSFPFPLTPGYDLVGEIAAVGTSVTSRFTEGDMVTLMSQHGGCQEYVVWDAGMVYKIDPKIGRELDPLQVVCLPLTGVTAYQMLTRTYSPHVAARLFLPDGKTYKPTTTILIHSCAGGTGNMAVRLARVLGIPAENIYGTCSSKNVDYARESGCGNPLDYHPDVGSADHWSKKLPQGGVDIVLDAVGGPTYYKSVSCLARGGSYIGYGLTNTTAPGTFALGSAVGQFTSMFFQRNMFSMLTGRTAVFYNVASLRDSHPEWYHADMTTLLELLHDKKLVLPLERVVSLEQVPKALESIANMQHRGKIVVAVNEELEKKEKESGRLYRYD